MRRGCSSGLTFVWVDVFPPSGYAVVIEPLGALMAARFLKVSVTDMWRVLPWHRSQVGVVTDRLALA
jgi:hypothetical protein